MGACEQAVPRAALVASGAEHHWRKSFNILFGWTWLDMRRSSYVHCLFLLNLLPRMFCCPISLVRGSAYTFCWTSSRSRGRLRFRLSHLHTIQTTIDSAHA